MSNSLEEEAERLGLEKVGIPHDVIPVPCGSITLSKAADIIFRAAAEKRRMFMRGGLVHEVRTLEEDVLEIIKPERFCSMVEKLGKRVASREKQTDSEGNITYAWRRRTFPKSSAQQILATDEAGIHLPHIQQLSNCPILTNTGEILTRGFHEFNGGTYISGGGMPVEVELEAAVSALVGILADFDFASPGDASRAVASLISPALKMGGHIADDFPLDMSEAMESQTGKDYRLKSVCSIYREEPRSITKAEGGVGSLDESISVALSRNRPFIYIANFRGTLASQIMEQAIRGSRYVQLRLPGGATPTVDVTSNLWQLSTNNAEFTRDIANRSIVCRLRKRPEGYKYRKYLEGDLHSHIVARQPAFLGAVFAIVRAWMAAGSPTTDECRHDFRGWCQALDWIVQNICGLPPLLDGHKEEQMRVANPKLQWLRSIIGGIVANDYDGRELTASDIADVAEDRDLPPPGRKDSNEAASMRVGRVLGHIFSEVKKESIVVDGHEFCRKLEDKFNPITRMTRAEKTYTIKTT